MAHGVAAYFPIYSVVSCLEYYVHQARDTISAQHVQKVKVSNKNWIINIRWNTISIFYQLRIHLELYRIFKKYINLETWCPQMIISFLFHIAVLHTVIVGTFVHREQKWSMQNIGLRQYSQSSRQSSTFVRWKRSIGNHLYVFFSEIVMWLSEVWNWINLTGFWEHSNFSSTNSIF